MNNLEQTHNLMDRHGDGSLPQRLTTRLQEICDDLAAAVTGLVTAQDQLGNFGTSNVEQLDRLIKSASNILRDDSTIITAGRKRGGGGEGGAGGKKRGVVGGIRSLRGGEGTEESGSVGGASSSPMSEGVGGEGGEGDWEPPVLKQPSVRVMQAVLTPRQRAELRKFSRDDDKDDATDATEITDEFASPEKPRTDN